MSIATKQSGVGGGVGFPTSKILLEGSRDANVLKMHHNFRLMRPSNIKMGIFQT